MGDFKRVEILFCTDATDASLKFESFQGAYLVAYVVPVVSQSEKISRVTKSSIALETLTLNKGADAVYFLARQEIPLLALHKKMNFSIKNYFSKWGKFRSLLRIDDHFFFGLLSHISRVFFYLFFINKTFMFIFL